jgi:hypothetical protein
LERLAALMDKHLTLYLISLREDRVIFSEEYELFMEKSNVSRDKSLDKKEAPLHAASLKRIV